MVFVCTKSSRVRPVADQDHAGSFRCHEFCLQDLLLPDISRSTSAGRPPRPASSPSAGDVLALNVVESHGGGARAQVLADIRAALASIRKRAGRRHRSRLSHLSETLSAESLTAGCLEYFHRCTDFRCANTLQDTFGLPTKARLRRQPVHPWDTPLRRRPAPEQLHSHRPGNRVRDRPRPRRSKCSPDPEAFPMSALRFYTEYGMAGRMEAFRLSFCRPLRRGPRQPSIDALKPATPPP